MEDEKTLELCEVKEKRRRGRPRKEDKAVVKPISFPKALMDWIESQRQDIPRSKFVCKILEENRKNHSAILEDINTYKDV